MVMIDLDLYYYRINACNYTPAALLKLLLLKEETERILVRQTESRSALKSLLGFISRNNNDIVVGQRVSFSFSL
jgi:hypothetical protein